MEKHIQNVEEVADQFCNLFFSPGNQVKGIIFVAPHQKQRGKKYHLAVGVAKEHLADVKLHLLLHKSCKLENRQLMFGGYGVVCDEASPIELASS